MAIKGLLGKIAPALLPLLELKARGENPDTLSDQLVPVIEMARLYLDGQAELLIAQGVLAPGSSTGYFVPCTNALVNSLVVPNDEIWFVHSYSGGLRSLVAGGSLGGHVGGAVQLRDGSSRYEWLWPLSAYANAGTSLDGWGDGEVLGFATQPMRYFPGGTVFGITYGSATLPVSGGDFECYMRVTKLKA